MEYNELTDAQKAKARECKTTDELLALAKEEGVELTDAQLEAVSGGRWDGCSDQHWCALVTKAEKAKWYQNDDNHGGASGSW